MIGVTTCIIVGTLYWWYTDETKVVVQGLNSYILAEKHGQLFVYSLKEKLSIKVFGKL